ASGRHAALRPRGPHALPPHRVPRAPGIGDRAAGGRLTAGAQLGEVSTHVAELPAEVVEGGPLHRLGADEAAVHLRFEPVDGGGIAQGALGHGPELPAKAFRDNAEVATEGLGAVLDL